MKPARHTTTDELFRNFVAAATGACGGLGARLRRRRTRKVVMTQTVILTDEQMDMVRGAAATLRWAERDEFMLDLASALARCHAPVTDLDLRVAIRKLLGVVPVDVEQR
jgi:hypothetical protein